MGNPNVGKSTLMNQLVGERVSIITQKAQTTRHRILGIVNADDYQIVFSDTPGVLKPKYKLQESMLNFSEGALTDADVLLYNSTIEGELRTMDELLAKCPMLADFKAVQSGNVWCTSQSLFQQSMELPELILDMNRVFTEDDPDDSELTFLTKLH